MKCGFPAFQDGSFQSTLLQKEKQTMSKDMLGPIVRALVGVPQQHHGVVLDVVNKLGGDNADDVRKRVAQVMREPAAAKDETKQLLEFVEPITLAAVERCVLADLLCEGETIDGLQIGWIGPNLKQSFVGKVEGPVAAREGRHHKLVVNDSFDSAIITELGGDRKVESSFGQFWKFLTTADRSLWYVAYIRDKHGVLWAVHAGWDGDELGLEADSLGHGSGWYADGRFVSP